MTSNSLSADSENPIRVLISAMARHVDDPKTNQVSLAMHKATFFLEKDSLSSTHLTRWRHKYAASNYVLDFSSVLKRRALYFRRRSLHQRFHSHAVGWQSARVLPAYSTDIILLRWLPSPLGRQSSWAILLHLADGYFSSLYLHATRLLHLPSTTRRKSTLARSAVVAETHIVTLIHSLSYVEICAK